MASRFELRWQDWTWQPGFGAAFLDYVVDGRSLWNDRRVGEDFHEIPALGWQQVPADDAAAARLLLEAPPDLGERTSIFVCASCGDLDCGSISVIIERDGGEIVWRDPANTSRDWEADPDADPQLSFIEPPPPRPPEQITIHVFREDFGRWPTELRFNAGEYRQAITQRPPPIPPRRG